MCVGVCRCCLLHLRKHLSLRTTARSHDYWCLCTITEDRWSLKNRFLHVKMFLSSWMLQLCKLLPTFNIIWSWKELRITDIYALKKEFWQQSPPSSVQHHLHDLTAQNNPPFLFILLMSGPKLVLNLMFIEDIINDWQHQISWTTSPASF